MQWSILLHRPLTSKDVTAIIPNDNHRNREDDVEDGKRFQMGEMIQNLATIAMSASILNAAASQNASRSSQFVLHISLSTRPSRGGLVRMSNQSV